MGKFVSVDIPDTVLRCMNVKENEPISAALKGVLTAALPKYFDLEGNFRGIHVGFAVPLYLSNGKQRTNLFTRVGITLDDRTACMLEQAKRYTTMSAKNFAEIVILKELVNWEVEADGQNRDVHHKQGTQTSD